MNLIQLEQSPSQEFGVSDYRVRLNYNHLSNAWSFTLFDSEGVTAIVAGKFLEAGVNLLESVGGTLLVTNSVPCPQPNWYNRLVVNYADGIPQTVLVYVI
jgi:hypothetical protein